MTLEQMIQEIKFFGVKATLDSIENIKSARLRRQERELFEKALNFLKNTEHFYSNMEFPDTKKW